MELQEFNLFFWLFMSGVSLATAVATVFARAATPQSIQKNFARQKWLWSSIIFLFGIWSLLGAAVSLHTRQGANTGSLQELFEFHVRDQCDSAIKNPDGSWYLTRPMTIKGIRLEGNTYTPNAIVIDNIDMYAVIEKECGSLR